MLRSHPSQPTICVSPIPTVGTASLRWRAPWLEKCEGRCFEPIELALDVVHPWVAGRHVLPAEVERAQVELLGLERRVEILHCGG
eukprot:scaffold4655_cov115-Isochrysis_galbana.AAC.11